MIPEEPVTYWSPGDYLTDQTENPVPIFALVVLNQPIVDAAVFTRLWKNAKARVCADGGANHLFGIRIDGQIPIPDCITGDLDSINDEVHEFYQSKGVEIVKDKSEYHTDFTKSLKWIYTHASSLDNERQRRDRIDPGPADAIAAAGDEGHSGDAHHEDQGHIGGDDFESDERRKRARIGLTSFCSATVTTDTSASATASSGAAAPTGDASPAAIPAPTDSVTAGRTATTSIASFDTNDSDNNDIKIGNSRTFKNSNSDSNDQDGTKEEGVLIDVVAYGATGGRVDQSFQAINQLFIASQSLSDSTSASQTHQSQDTQSSGRRVPKQGESDSHLPSNDTGSGSSNIDANTSPVAEAVEEDPYKQQKLCKRLILVTDESLTFLLEPGKNLIKTPLQLFGKTCGIIPISGPSMMTTRGLEWDLENYPTRFGGMVSSSNHLVKENVEIVTTEFMLWTMEIRRVVL